MMGNLWLRRFGLTAPPPRSLSVGYKYSWRCDRSIARNWGAALPCLMSFLVEKAKGESNPFEPKDGIRIVIPVDDEERR
jgi:hypothetical protein